MKMALLHVDDIKYVKNITISALGADLSLRNWERFYLIHFVAVL